jgi:hypothetical protein
MIPIDKIGQHSSDIDCPIKLFAPILHIEELGIVTINIIQFHSHRLIINTCASANYPYYIADASSSIIST